MSTDIGTGATIVFADSAFTGNIMSMEPFDAERPEVDTTHLATTIARTFIPADLIDWGSAVLTIQHDPDVEPPMDQAAEIITITYALVSGQSVAATLAGTGFATNLTASIPLEELMESTLTIKWSGDLTWTDSS